MQWLGQAAHFWEGSVFMLEESAGRMLSGWNLVSR